MMTTMLFLISRKSSSSKSSASMFASFHLYLKTSERRRKWINSMWSLWIPAQVLCIIHSFTLTENQLTHSQSVQFSSRRRRPNETRNRNSKRLFNFPYNILFFTLLFPMTWSSCFSRDHPLSLYFYSYISLPPTISTTNTSFSKLPASSFKYPSFPNEKKNEEDGGGVLHAGVAD